MSGPWFRGGALRLLRASKRGVSGRNDGTAEREGGREERKEGVGCRGELGWAMVVSYRQRPSIQGRYGRALGELW